MAKKKRTFEDDQAVIDAATKGPWLFDCGGRLHEGCIPEDPGSLPVRLAMDPDDPDIRGFIIGEIWNEADQRFVAHARERWPAALVRIRELEAEVENLSPVQKERTLWRAIDRCLAGWQARSRRRKSCDKPPTPWFRLAQEIRMILDKNE